MLRDLRWSLLVVCLGLACAQSGVEGPQGPQGVQGPQGPAGDAGPAGADGQSVTVTLLPPNDPRCPAGGVLFTSASGESWACHGVDGTSPQAGVGLLAAGPQWSLDTLFVEGLARGVAYDSPAELAAELDGRYLPATYAPSWSQLSAMPAGFADGTDDGLQQLSTDLTLSGDGTAGAPLAVRFDTVQRRISGGCPVGSLVRSVNQDGSLQCEPPPPRAGDPFTDGTPPSKELRILGAAPRFQTFRLTEDIEVQNISLLLDNTTGSRRSVGVCIYDTDGKGNPTVPKYVSTVKGLSVEAGLTRTAFDVASLRWRLLGKVEYALFVSGIPTDDCSTPAFDWFATYDVDTYPRGRSGEAALADFMFTLTGKLDPAVGAVDAVSATGTAPLRRQTFTPTTDVVATQVQIRAFQAGTSKLIACLYETGGPSGRDILLAAPILLTPEGVASHTWRAAIPEAPLLSTGRSYALQVVASFATNCVPSLAFQWELSQRDVLPGGQSDVSAAQDYLFQID